jgi:acyl-CoA synthetase (NDP forming)
MKSLSRLFQPKSIAVIGGGAWCASVAEQAQKMGFTGKIFAVHPKQKPIGALSSYASVTDLPCAPDASFIGVNRHATIEVVAQLRAIGAGGAVCFASGFSEAEHEDDSGADLQAQLITAAGNMPIVTV